MRRWTTILITGLLALLMVAAAACGGGGDKKADPGVSDQNGAGAGGSQGQDNGGGVLGDLLVADPRAALGKSVEVFSQEVRSMEGTFVFSISGGGFGTSMNGEFAYRAPDSAYMSLGFDASGDENLAMLGNLGMEIIVLGDTFYMNTPFFGGWVKMSTKDLGADAEQYKQLLQNHAPFDYSALIEQLDGVKYVGEDEIDGKAYVHVSVETDFAALMDALSDSFSSSGLDTGVPMDSLSGPVTVDVWVDPDTGLPRRFAASGSMDVPSEPDAMMSGPMTFEMTFDAVEYNGDVDIPAPPADAKSFLEMMSEGGLFGDD